MEAIPERREEGRAPFGGAFDVWSSVFPVVSVHPMQVAVSQVVSASCCRPCGSPCPPSRQGDAAEVYLRQVVALMPVRGVCQPAAMQPQLVLETDRGPCLISQPLRKVRLSRGFSYIHA